MNRKALLTLLRSVRTHRTTPEAAAERLRHLPYEDMGFAQMDSHRALRQGFPEVIFCEGKTAEQVAAIAERIVEHHGALLATRATSSMFDAGRAVAPRAVYHPLSRAITVKSKRGPGPKGRVLVVSAFTSDIPVAEAALRFDQIGFCELKI